jgi:hypothetical protein
MAVCRGPAPMPCALAECGKRLSGPPLDSALALWKRGWLQLSSGDFRRQGNPAEATPASQQQPHRVQCRLHYVQPVSDSRTCSVSKSITINVGGGICKWISSPHMVFREFIKHTFHFLIEAVLHIISFILCWDMNVQNNDMTPVITYDILSVINSTLLTAAMILLCTRKPVPNL